LLDSLLQETSEMGKKGKKRQVLQGQEAQAEVSSDEGPTPMKKRMLRPVSSDSEVEEPPSNKREMRKRKVERDDISQSSKKRKMLRCADSSDEENVENSSVSTPKAERVNKLEEMRKKIQAKKKVIYDSSNEESSDGQDWLEEDEESLPMWANEEAPPEDKLDDSENSDLGDFIVNDEDENMDEKPLKLKKTEKLVQDNDNERESKHELSDAEEKLRKRKKRKQSGLLNKGESSPKSEGMNSSENEEQALEESSEEEKPKVKKKAKKKKAVIDDDEEGSDSSEEETDYANPYMLMDRDMEDANILDLLSKNTDKDKKNAKKYKKEMGKYQYAVHSDKNRAAKVSKKARFASNMETVKADKGFKAERNLDIKDAEYHDYKETCLYGERIRIFPHTRRYSKYASRCALRGCGEPFSVGETRIIGITKFCDINFRFMKKLNNFGKESFYYVCAHHLPKSGSDSEEYSSGED